MGQQLAKILYNQADKFLQQVNDIFKLSTVVDDGKSEIKVLVFFTQLQTFEDLLKNEKLKPFEQMKVRTTTHSLLKNC